jgi:hypothetical protein
LIPNVVNPIDNAMTTQSIASSAPCGIHVSFAITVSNVAQRMGVHDAHTHTEARKVWWTQHSFIVSDLAWSMCIYVDGNITILP